MALSKNKSTKRKQMAKIKGGKKPVTGLKKLPFGGYVINFSGQTATVEQVFGKNPIPPSTMTKLIWKYVKSKNLGNR